MSISVVIPTYEANGYGTKHFAQLLDSISKQEGVEFDVIISDNSKDDTIEKLCKTYTNLDIRYIRNNETFGIANNTNNAIVNATSQFIKIMYQDDYFVATDALLLFKMALWKKGWVTSASVLVDNNENVTRSHQPFWNGDKILAGQNPIGMPSVVAVRKSDIIFDTKLHTCLDCEYYWLHYKKFGEPERIKKPLVAMRIWDGSSSAKMPDTKKEDYEYLKRKHSL